MRIAYLEIEGLRFSRHHLVAHPPSNTMSCFIQRDQSFLLRGWQPLHLQSCSSELLNHFALAFLASPWRSTVCTGTILSTELRIPLDHNPDEPRPSSWTERLREPAQPLQWKSYGNRHILLTRRCVLPGEDRVLVYADKWGREGVWWWEQASSKLLLRENQKTVANLPKP